MNIAKVPPVVGPTAARSGEICGGSWVKLSPEFFAAIAASPVPLDMRALKALKRPPLALDLHAWATHKSNSVAQGERAVHSLGALPPRRCSEEHPPSTSSKVTCVDRSMGSCTNER
jgi:hypothetical protein